MTLKFDRWPRKNREPQPCTFNHSITICEFKLKLQSGNAQFGSKLAIFVSCDLEISWITLKNNRRLFYSTSFVHNFIPICELKLELQSGNAQFRSKSSIFRPVWLKIRRATSKKQKNKTTTIKHLPLLYPFKGCALFRSHLWIEWAHDALITSLLRQNEVATSFWRHNDVIFTLCVRWVELQTRNTQFFFLSRMNLKFHG